MTLDRLHVVQAVQRFQLMPQTDRVFIVPGPHKTYMVLWVLKSGARHHLSTQEQVFHALGA